MRNTLLLASLVGLMLAGVGCQQDYNVTFVNSTQRDMTATLTGPGDIDPSPPTLPVARQGGQAQFKLKVDDDDLPANYTWTADGRRGTLVLTEDSRSDQVINIGPAMTEDEKTLRGTLAPSSGTIMR